MKVLQIVPCDIDEANAFVMEHHRHHGKLPGAKFAVAVAANDRVCGVALVGRPCRLLQDGFTLEVTRNCTDGTKNACSMLYAACWRAARALGYRKMLTYIGQNEKGTSVVAAWSGLPGFKIVGEVGGGSWNRKLRPRVDKHPTQSKIRFEIALTPIESSSGTGPNALSSEGEISKPNTSEFKKRGARQ